LAEAVTDRYLHFGHDLPIHLSIQKIRNIVDTVVATDARDRYAPFKCR